MSDVYSRWIASIGCVLVMSLAAPNAPAQSENARTRSCDHFMENYSRSSARKLARALSGQGYRLETLELNESFAAKLSDGEVTFEAFFEKEDRAAGIADDSRKHRRTYTIVGTDQGPVITSHRWPSRAEVARGADCRPDSSRIEAPKVSVRDVDVKPFKFWGLRVTWHLPESFPDELRDDPLDALLGVVGNPDDAQETAESDEEADSEKNGAGGGESGRSSGESNDSSTKSTGSNGDSTESKSDRKTDAARVESKSE